MDNRYLAHHGIMGQRWGIRRFQNQDGSLTEEGKRRYYTDNDEYGRDLDNDELSAAVRRMQQESQFKKLNDEIYKSPAQKRYEEKEKAKEERRKKIRDAAFDAAVSSGKAVTTALLTNGLNYAVGVATGNVENTGKNFANYLYLGKGQFKPAEPKASSIGDAVKEAAKSVNDTVSKATSSSSGSVGVKGSKWNKRDSKLSDDYNRMQMKYSYASGYKDDISGSRSNGSSNNYTTAFLEDHSSRSNGNSNSSTTAMSIYNSGASRVTALLEDYGYKSFYDATYDPKSGHWR